MTLLDAVEELIPGTWSVFRGEATTARPPLPRIAWRATAPGGGDLSESAGAFSGSLDVTVHAAAADMTSAWAMVAAVQAAMTGARPDWPGCGCLVPLGVPRVDPEADLVVTAASGHLWVGTARYRLTVTTQEEAP